MSKMNCHCHCHQSKTKRKADYHATSTLIARSEWLRLTPEEKAEIERQDQAHAEWVEKWNNMTFSEHWTYMCETIAKSAQGLKAFRQ